MGKPPRIGSILTAVMLSTLALALGRAYAAPTLTQPRLSIASPSSGSLVGGQVQVAVAFDAGAFGKVTALELWVNDRFYAASQVDSPGPRGTFNLDLDTLRLANGQHALKVRALFGRKVIATDAAIVTVTNGGVDVVPPLVSFNSPMDGDTISGTATIDINAVDNDRVALVSLFINKLPVMLRSAPPYTYLLDTTTLPLQDGKGSLLLEAMAYDRAQNVGKAKPIHVYVKNPVNATPLQPDPAPHGSGPAVPGPGAPPADRSQLPHPSVPPAGPSAVPQPQPGTPAPALRPGTVASAATSSGARATTPPSSRPTTAAVPTRSQMVRAPKLAPASGVPEGRMVAGSRTAEPPSSRPSRSAPTVAPAPSHEDATLVLPLGPPIRVAGSASPDARLTTPSTKRRTTLRAVPSSRAPRLPATRPAPVKLPPSTPPALVSGKEPIAVAPRDLVAKSTVPELRAVPRTPAAAAPATLPKAEVGGARIPMQVYVVRPVPETMAKSRAYLVARGDRLSQIARDHGVTPQSILVANGLRDATQLRAGARLIIPGTFNVAMNDGPVGFDVSPRVERGLPIAPFRQIFEHAGGVVVYYPESRSLTARKPEKEIQVKIGSKEAMVNQAVVLMDRAAFIDSGRTMLPMRFITEALDMKAEYDPKSGTLYLTRKDGKIAGLPAPR